MGLALQALRAVEYVDLLFHAFQPSHFLSSLFGLCLKPSIELFLRIETLYRLGSQCYGQLGGKGGGLQLVEQGKVHADICLYDRSNAVVFGWREEALQRSVGWQHHGLLHLHQHVGLHGILHDELAIDLLRFVHRLLHACNAVLDAEGSQMVGTHDVRGAVESVARYFP